jgi:hypothetical protein
MRHTVIGVFDTFALAEDARDALVAAGFPRGDIELQANPQRDDSAEPALGTDADTREQPGVLANIERFFSMLFGGRERPPEVAHYSEAVRRGAVLVAVDTPDEVRANAARTTLSAQGAIDIDERAASWGALGRTTASERVYDERADDRDHSVLDELGLGRGSGVPGKEPVNPPPTRPAAGEDVLRARAYPHADVGDPALEPLRDPLERTDPASLTPRDYVSDPADDPLMPRQRGTSMSRDSVSERDALAGRDPLSALEKGSMGETDRLTRDAVAERDALTGREAPAPGNPLPGVSTEGARDWRPVDPLDPLRDTEMPADIPQAARAAPPASTGDAGRMAAGAPLAGTPPRSTPMSGMQTREPLGPQTVPDEYMEYEDDFRSDYTSRYSATGSPYEDYEGAYRYGATLGNDERFRNRAWDEQMEYEVQREWQSREPQGADTWERFKAAIRHGWDRVTGHHHV